MVIKEYFKKHSIIALLTGFTAKVVFITYRFIFKRDHIDGLTLIIALHKLGDTIFTIPAIQALTENSETKIIIFCFDESRILYKINFSKNKNIDYFTLSRSDLLWEGRIVPRRIKKKLFKKYKFNTIVDLTGGIFSASIIIDSKVTSVVGCSEPIFLPLYDVFSTLRTTPHLMDLYLDTIKLLYPKIKTTRLKYFSQSFNVNDPILVHPYAGWAAKEWGFQNFIELVILLSKLHPVKMIIPKNKLSEDLVANFSLKKINMLVTDSIDELVAVLNKCSLLISNDSGPIQIASLLGKPTFAIFGPVNPAFAVPFGKYHKFIQKKINCSPVDNEKYCFTDAGRNGCPSFECMKQLSVDEVFHSVEKFLFEIEILNSNTTLVKK